MTVLCSLVAKKGEKMIVKIRIFVSLGPRLETDLQTLQHFLPRGGPNMPAFSGIGSFSTKLFPQNVANRNK